MKHLKYHIYKNLVTAFILVLDTIDYGFKFPLGFKNLPILFILVLVIIDYGFQYSIVIASKIY